MTTFRCRTVRLEDVRYVGVSSNDPDAIGVEVTTNANEHVFDVYRDHCGRSSICLGTPPVDPGWEMDLHEFEIMVARCLAQIDDWEKNLRVPGGPWTATGAPE
ncbi:MAG: hypothetical protein QOH86_1056 [Sphingomonadales bacterium]|jgi:hypothetical protein|nr:hypothetical protein [Sphingomonadales bacterium]